MASLVIDTVQHLLSQYTFQIETGGIVEDLSCISCQKLTINPYQTHCGCIYCQECVTVHFGNSDKYCSGGREGCREEYIILEKNVLKSAVLNRNILRLKVRCPNRSCESVTELIHMCEHLRVCIKHLQKCPFSNIGCDDDGISKDGMLTHLHDNSITHSEMLVDLIQNLRNEINELKENRNQTKLEIPTVPRLSRAEEAEKEQWMNEMAERMNARSSERMRDMEMINKANVEKIRLLDEQMQRQENELQSLKKEILIKIEEEKKECNSKMTEKELKTRQLEEQMLRQENELQSLKKEILIKIEEEKKECNSKTTEKELKTRQLEEQIQTQENELQSQKKEIWDKIEKDKEIGSCLVTSVSVMQSRVNELVRVIGGINIRTVLFKVHGFSTSRNSVKGIYSPHFYSHTNGYKLRLLVYPGGNGDGSGTYMSVYIDVCKGEYDDLLEWPFWHSVTISVVNQINGENHASRILSYSTAADAFKSLYHKPIERNNTGDGYPTFIPHTTLQSSPGVIVRDALILRCAITPPQIGTTIFRVDGFSARKASVEEIYSPHFYSHTGGYKLRLVVYPGGYHDARGTHVSVYLVVCKGEYDDLLEWPCMHSATISVVNQISGENHTSDTLSYSSASDRSKLQYHKPIKGDNSGFGRPSFISHTTLESSAGLIVDNTLHLRCVITPPL